MILHLDGFTNHSGTATGPFRKGPAQQHSVPLQPEVVMEACCMMFFHSISALAKSMTVGLLLSSRTVFVLPYRPPARRIRVPASKHDGIVAFKTELIPKGNSGRLLPFCSNHSIAILIPHAEKAPSSKGWGSRLCRRSPNLPHTYACSTIGPTRLNFRVRDGNGCDPRGKLTGKLLKFRSRDLPQLNRLSRHLPKTY